MSNAKKLEEEELCELSKSHRESFMEMMKIKKNVVTGGPSRKASILDVMSSMNQSDGSPVSLRKRLSKEFKLEKLCSPKIPNFPENSYEQKFE